MDNEEPEYYDDLSAQVFPHCLSALCSKALLKGSSGPKSFQSGPKPKSF